VISVFVVQQRSELNLLRSTVAIFSEADEGKWNTAEDEELETIKGTPFDRNCYVTSKNCQAKMSVVF
jgi:hypothetical protein